MLQIRCTALHANALLNADSSTNMVPACHECSGDCWCLAFKLIGLHAASAVACVPVVRDDD